ncbi:MAG: leucine-rich repeat domain-containing protein, partial [Lachnospiraceae bacterium]|nr:leucine-rich repeat domain-containing protein [Lachnospiraceae bacterium]
PARKGENYVMPESVEEMDTYAFWNLQNVKNVKLSERIDSIPKYAMTNMGSVENVSLPGSVKAIEERAFANNENLTQVSVPASVSEIDRTAFSGSPNVKIFTTKGTTADTFGSERKIEVIYTKEYPVDFMDSNEDLEELPDVSGSVENNTNVTTITTVTEIETGASEEETEAGGNQNESGFESAENYIHPLDVPEPDEVIGKTVISTGKAVMLMNNHDGQVYGLPDGVKADVITESEAAKKEMSENEAQESAAAENSTAGSEASNTKPDVNISYDESNLNSDEYIPQRKFYKQKSLTNYEISETIKSIGRLAFAESGLKSVRIPEGVTQIEYGAFMSCANLDTVSIADTVISIGTKAFEGTKWLNEWKNGKAAGDENDFLIVGDGILLAYRGDSEHVQIPEGVKQIGSEVFKGHSEILDADVPASVVRINAEAFRNCSSLTGLTGCEGLNTVIRGAFYGTQLSETNFTKD